MGASSTTPLSAAAPPATAWGPGEGAPPPPGRTPRAGGGGPPPPPLRHTPTAAGAVLADVTRELREAAADWHEARTALRAHRHHSTLPHTPSPVDHPSRAGDEDV